MINNNPPTTALGPKEILKQRRETHRSSLRVEIPADDAQSQKKTSEPGTPTPHGFFGHQFSRAQYNILDDMPKAPTFGK